MIEIVEGYGVGAGKTYYVVSDRVIPHFVRGGTIFSSDKFQLEWENLKQLVRERFRLELQDDQWQQVPADKLGVLHEFTAPGTDECPVLIIVDEAQGGLHSHDTKDKTKRAFFEWLCESRHDSNDLLFITQNSANIDVQIRRLATNYVRVRNMATFKVAGVTFPKFLVRLGFGFLVNVFDQTGKCLQERRWLPHDPKVFGAYVSKSCKGAHKRAAEAIARKQLQTVPRQAKPLTKNMKLAIIAIIAALCVGIIVGGPRLAQGFGMASKADAKSRAVPSAPAPSVQPTAAAPTATPRPAYTIEREQLRAYYGSPSASGRRRRDTLVTHRGTYTPGEICEYGMVETVSARQGIYVALIKGPDRYLVYVLAEPARQAAAPSTLATAAK